MPWEIKMADDQHCVHKKGESSPIKGGCHDSHEDAVKHMRALYANEPKMYNAIRFSESMVEDTESDNVKWIQAWRYSKWQHPQYGEVEITPQFGERLKQNFDAQVYGQEIMVDFEHGLDRAKGAQSAADILDIDPRDDGVWYKVAFTEDALKEIKERKWKYFSPEYAEELLDSETEELYQDVPVGGALTNRPFFKGMAPLNFSELFVESEIPEHEEGGNTVDELTLKFAEKLGIELTEDMDEEAILAKADELNAVIKPLKDVKDEGERTKSFREAFPEEYERSQRLEADKVERDSLAFSENYARFTVKDGEKEQKSNFGFSQLVMDEIASVHKKFSDRSATHEDLKNLLDRIGDKGIVDYAEKGSSRTPDKDDRDENPTKAFSDLVLEIMKADELEYEPAMNQARSREPELFMAYKNSIPQR